MAPPAAAAPKKETAAAAPKKEKKEKKPTEAAEKLAEVEKAPAKPDDSMYETQLDALAKEIDEKKDKIKAIAAKIEVRNEGKEQYEQDKKELHNRATDTQNRISDLFKQRTALRNEENDAKKAERERKNNLKRMERDVESMSEEKIDAKIREIEFSMHTKSMDLKTEKSLMRDIAQLKKQKPEAARNAANYEKMKEENAVSAVDPNKSSADRLGELSTEIDELKAKSEKEWEAIKALKDARAKQLDGLSELTEGKKALRDDCEKLVAKKKEVIDAKRAAQKAYNDWDRNQRVERQKKRNAENARMKAEWDAETARKELEKPNPYLDQTTLLTQTIDYCKTLVAADQPKEKDAVPEAIDTSNMPDNARVLLKKGDRDTEVFHACTKKKNLRQKANKKNVGIVKHQADTFATFAQLEIPAPTTTQDVVVTLERLQEKLAMYNAKVAVWEETRKAKLEKAAQEGVEAPAVEAAAE